MSESPTLVIELDYERHRLLLREACVELDPQIGAILRVRRPLVDHRPGVPLDRRQRDDRKGEHHDQGEPADRLAGARAA